VFVHGLTFDRTSWQPIIDRLAGRYRCTAVDLPGHGDSDGPPRPLADIAAALHRLLDALGIGRPVVVGHSMGAPVVCIYAAAYPVRGVVDVDQPLFVRPFAELVHSLAPGLRGRRLRHGVRTGPAEHRHRPAGLQSCAMQGRPSWLYPESGWRTSDLLCRHNAADPAVGHRR
jgi:pimeloyl-ACP methyl ester carboxylesterase